MATLIGAGGHADDIYASFPSLASWGGWTWSRISHHSEFWAEGYKPFPVIIGINNPQKRAEVAEDLGREDLAWVHPDAHLYHDVTYRYGTHINYGAMMTRTTLGSHCTIAPGVHMAGDITIGDRVFIGIGAIVGNLLTIGDDAIIGAGSVVLKDVPAGTKVLGVWA